MSQVSPHAVDLSVVVGTAHPSPELDRLFAALLPQLARTDGELIVADGSPGGIALPSSDDVPIVHLREPGLDVFALRALGGARASGWVVAFTEDHCAPVREDWCELILAAHLRHGHTAAVTGATANGTPDTIWNRANFLLTFGPVMPPLRAVPPDRVPPPANISVKREVLAEHELTRGFLEFELMPHLSHVGHVAADDRILIRHYQSHSARWFLVHHFHNGRTTGGLLRRELRSRRARVRRGFTSLALVPRHLRQTWAEARRRPGQWRAAFTATPAMALLLGAHAVGELVGMAAGAGHSPHELA